LEISRFVNLRPTYPVRATSCMETSMRRIRISAMGPRSRTILPPPCACWPSCWRATG